MQKKERQSMENNNVKKGQGFLQENLQFMMITAMGTAAGKNICTILKRYRKDLQRLIK